MRGDRSPTPSTTLLFAEPPTASPSPPSTSARAAGCSTGRSPPRLWRTLVERVSNIDTIAVHPDHRGQGIATRILDLVEDDFRQAGYRALTLRHEHGKKHFFTARGYSSLPRLAVDLPPTGLFTRAEPGWKFAVKPLDDTVTLTSQRGVTTITGLLD
ncbi:GNAT family N-acetyltransferase [Streptomyces sp900105245]|uniref:GNAT family N-acetyltransferase n=1 Tax=Streptomyces sp. 900105245 TaxID=3154379 RepID=A0ABV1UIY6_9ACTN